MQIPLKISVLFSGSASSWRFLQEHDPDYGIGYVVVSALTDKKEASAIENFEKASIPCDVLDYKEWIKANPIADKDERRTQYFEEVKKTLSTHKPDLVLLLGYMKKVKPNLYNHFLIANVHPADLTILDEKGNRKYVGDDAVTLAFLDGVKETRSTVHEVNEETDGGPIICLSEPLTVFPGRTAKEHQEAMKFACDGPAVMRAIQLIKEGRYTKQVGLQAA